MRCLQKHFLPKLLGAPSYALPTQTLQKNGKRSVPSAAYSNASKKNEALRPMRGIEERFKKNVYASVSCAAYQSLFNKLPNDPYYALQNNCQTSGPNLPPNRIFKAKP